MGCCGQAEEGDEDRKAKKQNKEIEKQIQKDKQVHHSNRIEIRSHSSVHRNQIHPIHIKSVWGH